MYQKLSGSSDETPKACHFDDFEIRNGKLYYKDKSKPLTTKKGYLKSAGTIAEMLGKEGLRNLGFDVPTGKVTARQAVILNKAEEELPSMSDIAKANDIGLQEIMENASRSMENLNQQTRGRGFAHA